MQSSTEVSLSAIVLAGGLSTRMGQDKALISIAGVPLLQRVCQIALQCTDTVYLVSPWCDRYQSFLNSSIQFVQEIPAPGAANSETPLKGFVQGLAQVQSEWVLLLACDLPQLDIGVLQHWIMGLEDAEAIALLPKNPEGWWEPLCGFYRVSCLVDLERFLEQGGRSFQGWLKDQTVQELALSDATMLLNCNTLDDLKRVQN
ncbi:MAG: molybdenum cofactor guanylyltransferase [Oscillatoriophycideae cyanobacterium NC_groundwater_1537_Pr4_S-0.65um_50_18]|nr:molybdenum cofactor guanylyltransferase [Oscillatoriophycideae cyanobacterium NC_groundwater_1537_Pr4_S-0.65um_50_18]